MTTLAERPEAAAALPERLRLRLEIEEFNVAYCRALDEGRLFDWVDFFTEDALYNVTARENHDAGLPVGLIYCEGRGMIHDRAFAITETAMFAPRYLRHLVTNLHLERVEAEGEILAEANYLLLQTLFDRPETTIHQAGRYLDRFRRGPQGQLLLAQRICVYDNLLVPNSLVYPV